MPEYSFMCTGCGTAEDKKLSMAEHEKIKNNILCPKCGTIMLQCVAPLRFFLKGQGWFGNSETAVDPYGITDMETRKNLDIEKRIEDQALNMSEKDKS